MMVDQRGITLKTIEHGERLVRLRLPFRFGNVTVREARQAFVAVSMDVGGIGRCTGFAAELKVPKWFDKSPDLSNDDNVAQLNQSLALAAQAYLSDRRPTTVFGYHERHAAAVRSAGAAAQLPGLVSSFGLALLDRALIDGLGRALDLSFAKLLQTNAVGFSAGRLAPDLGTFDTGRFLAGLMPVASIGARHTVGLLDALTTADAASDAPQDGLPVTLEDVIQTYGHRDFKLKLQGDVARDLARLTAIASVLDERLGAGAYRVTLDGNEQYQSAAHLADLMRALEGHRPLAGLLSGLLYVEQPIARASALSVAVANIGGRVPVIIDESDGEDGTLPVALRLGYRGVSSKACKGVWRSLVNKARLAAVEGSVLAGEDLTTQAGLGVQQDLALVSVLGLDHVERNGHHYVDGFGDAPAAETAAFLAAHGDLYRQQSGRVRLAITAGQLALHSVNRAAGLGSDAVPDFRSMSAVASWA